jgi:DNA polymerase-3 subunit alpha
LRFTGLSKKDMLRRAPLLYAPEQKKKMGVPQLFKEPEKHFILPSASDSAVEDAFDEMALLGFPTTLSYFQLLHPDYARPNITAGQLTQYLGKRVRIVGLLVTYKTIRTRKGFPMVFGTLLDAEGNFFDTTHFPESLAKYQFHGRAPYYIEGLMVEEFGVPSIEVQFMERLPLVTDPRFETVRVLVG